MADLTTLLDQERWPVLAQSLSPWVTRQRWFAGKARTVVDCTIADAALLGKSLALVLVDVVYADGGAERYHVPLAAGEPGVVDFEGVPLRDAVDVPEAMQAVAEASLSAGGTGSAVGGVVDGSPVEGHRLDGGPEPTGAPRRVDLARARRLGVEQSNSSVVLDDALILKIFRRLEAGVHPDVEITRALTEAGFAHVPPQAGALQLERSGHEPMYLAVLSSFLDGAREGWDIATAEARAVLSGSAQTDLAGRLRDLGTVVAGMHVALRDALGAEAGTAEQAAAWSRELKSQAEAVLDLASARDPGASAAVRAARAELLARFDDLAGVEDPGLLVRTHGDLHLGQVLLDRDAPASCARSTTQPRAPASNRRPRWQRGATGCAPPSSPATGRSPSPRGWCPRRPGRPCWPRSSSTRPCTSSGTSSPTGPIG